MKTFINCSKASVILYKHRGKKIRRQAVQEYLNEIIYFKKLENW